MQVCTAVGGLTIVGAGQVVVVQLLPVLGDEAVQVATATLVVLFGAQVVVVQALPEVGPDAVQLDTPVGPVVIGAGQVVVVQLLPEVGPEAVHEDTGTLVVTSAGQVVAVQLLPEAAAVGVQLAIGVGPVTTGAGQVVAVQALPEPAIAGVQVSTGTLVVLLGVQVVAVQALRAVAALTERSSARRPEPVTTGAGQVVVVQALPDARGARGAAQHRHVGGCCWCRRSWPSSCCRPRLPLACRRPRQSDRSSPAPGRSSRSSYCPALAADGVQDATGTLVVLLVEQVVVVQALSAEALAAEQVGVGTLVVTSGLQVVVV